MAELTDLTEHRNYTYENSVQSDFYNDIVLLINKYQADSTLTATDIVGCLEWAKTNTILCHTEYADD